MLFSEDIHPEEWNRLEEELKEIEEELKRRPDDEHLLLRKGVLLLKLKREPEAFAIGEGLSRLEKSEQQGHFIKSLACYMMRKLDDSLLFLQDTIKASPSDGILYVMKAAMLDDRFGAEAHEDIILCADRAIQLSEDTTVLTGAYYIKVSILMKLGKHFDALEVLDEAGGQVNPSMMLPQNVTAKEYFDSEMLEALCDCALDTWERKDLDKHTEYVENAYELGERCIEEYPNSPTFFVKFGLLLLRMGEFSEALEVFDKGISGSPHAIFLYLLKADTFNLIGKKEAAMDVLREIEDIKGATESDMKLCQEIAEGAGHSDEGYMMVKRYVAKQSMEEASPLISILPGLIDDWFSIKEQLDEGVSYAEVEELADSWGLYRKRAVSPDKVLEWLRQFRGNENQKVMLAVLKAIKFFREEDGKAMFREMHRAVERKMKTKGHSDLVAKNRLILISLGPPDCSETSCMRTYRQEIGIPKGNRASRERIIEVIDSNRKARALVFVDDFIGTGETACERIDELERIAGDVIRSRDIYVLFVFLCANKLGAESVRTKIVGLFEKSELLVYETIDDEDKVFGELSQMFNSEDEKKTARALSEEYGRKLWEEYPLGYRDCANTVVFADNCPNNSLTVLWSNKDGWKPLFPRS